MCGHIRPEKSGQDPLQNLSIGVLVKKSIEPLVLLGSYLALFHGRVLVSMMQYDRDRPFCDRIFKDIHVRHVQDDDTFNIEGALDELSRPIVYLLHRRSHAELVLALRINLIAAFQTLSAKLFHLMRKEKGSMTIEKRTGEQNIRSFEYDRESSVGSGKACQFHSDVKQENGIAYRTQAYLVTPKFHFTHRNGLHDDLPFNLAMTKICISGATYRKLFECMSLPRRKLVPWDIVHHRQSTYIETFLRPKWCCSVKSHTSWASNQWLREHVRRR